MSHLVTVAPTGRKNMSYVVASVDLNQCRTNYRGEQLLPIKLKTSVSGIRFTAEILLSEEANAGEPDARRTRLLQYLQNLNVVEVVEITSHETIHLKKE